MEIKYKIHIISDLKHEKMEIQTYAELIYAMEGHAEIIIYDQSYILRKNEYILINFANRYSLSASDDAVLAVLDIDYPSLLQVTGKNWWQFNCNTLLDTTRSHYNLKYYFSKMLRAHLLKDRQLEEKSAFYGVIDVLITEYSLKQPATRKLLENTKMDRVLLYLNMHYKEKITLEDICKKFFYANSTFSRNFKQQTGTNFIQYLNELRIHSAVSELMATDHSVTEIALDNGFSDTAVFNKVFKKIIGIAPLQYKRKTLEKQNLRQSVNETIIKNVENRFINEVQLNLNSNENKLYEEITMNAQADVPVEKIWTKAVGVKNASLLLSATYQEQIKILSERMHIKYLRIGGIFSKSMHIRDEKEKLNFRHIDDILDYCINNNFIPILEISGMRQTVIDDDHELVCMENQSDFFADYDDYAIFIKKFFEHISFRFISGAERIHEWIWELDYDRKTFSWEDYVKQFQLVYERIKKWNCKIGGYGVFLGCPEWDELEQFVKMECCPDFVSVSAYPYEVRKKNQGIIYYERSIDKKFFKNNILKIKNFLNQIGYSEMPVWITRWNSSLVEKNVFNDSFAKAAFIMDVVSDLTGLVEIAIYDSVSDLDIDSHDDQNHVFIGAPGLLSKDGLEKPSAVVLTDLSFLGNRLIQKGNHHFFTSFQKNHLMGMCYNHMNFNLNYYQKPEKMLEEDSLPYIYENQDSLEQKIEISNLANGIYRVKYGLISKKGSVLSKYRKMCNNVLPDIGDLKILKSRGYVEVMTLERKVIDGKMNITVNLKSNETVFLNIIPTYLE